MIERVRLNVDWIEAWMIRNKYTKSEFSAHFGYRANWWCVNKRRGGMVKR